MKKIQDAILICKDRLLVDKSLIQNSKPPKSDFDEFMESRCEALEILINFAEGKINGIETIKP